MKKIIGKISALAIAISAITLFVFGCGSTDNGGDGDHTCENMCPVCGYCIDVDCYADACWDKCGDALLYDAGFEAIDLKVAKSNVTATTALGCVTDFNKANNSSITFKVDASETATVTLMVTVGKTSAKDVFTDVTAVTVNGEKLERSTFIPVYEPEIDSNRFTEICLGCVELTAGENYFMFVAEGDGENSHDFKKLTIIGDGYYTLLQSSGLAHECSTVCVTCGGCNDFTCYNDGCAVKCTCDGGAPATLFWVCDERCETNRPVNAELDGIGCTWNAETRMKYVIGASEAGKITLGAVVSRDSKAVKFTDQFVITVNGISVKGEGVIPASDGGGREWNNYGLVVIGEIELVAGRNEIVFSQTPRRDVTNCAYNFQSMVLFGNGVYDWHIDEPSDTADEHLCAVCGGCPEDNCEFHDAECVCVPYDIGWKHADISGANKANEKENCIGVAAYNKLSRIEYTVVSNGGGKARMSFNVSCLPSEPYVNTIFHTVKVNGAPISTDAKIPKGVKWTDYKTVYIGAVDMQDGINTVVIEYTTPNSDNSVNFRSLVLASDTLVFEPFAGHEMTKHDAVAATCTSDGNIEYYTCSCHGTVFADADGKTEITLEATKIVATGHSYASELKVNGAKTDYEPNDTFDTSGMTVTLDCENCDDGDIVLSDEQYVLSKTTALDVSDSSITVSYKHDGKTYEYVLAINVAHTHVLGELVAAVDATCETAGNAAYYECGVCGKYYADAQATDEITDPVIAALGHSLGDVVARVEPTCIATGNIEYYECGSCNKRFIDAEANDTAENTVLEIDPAAHNRIAVRNNSMHYCYDCKNAIGYEFGLDRLTDVSKAPGKDGIGSSWNIESRFTYNIIAEKAGVVMLFVYLSRDTKEKAFTDIYKVYVNGSDRAFVGTGVVKAYPKREWAVYDRIQVGDIELVQGLNTIKFSFTPVTEDNGGDGLAYNFKKIMLVGDGEYSWAFCDICDGCIVDVCEHDGHDGCVCGKLFSFCGMDDRVLYETSDGVGKNWAENEMNLSGKNGRTETTKFYIRATENTTAKLYLNCSAISGSDRWHVAFNATWSVTVNGVDKQSATEHHDEQFMAGDGVSSRFLYYKYELVCEIELVAGVNEIVFTSTGKEALNMRDIAFTNVADAELSLADPREYVAPHACENACPTCGNCTDATCDVDVCKPKCECVPAPETVV